LYPKGARPFEESFPKFLTSRVNITPRFGVAQQSSSVPGIRVPNFQARRIQPRWRELRQFLSRRSMFRPNSWSRVCNIFAKMLDEAGPDERTNIERSLSACQQFRTAVTRWLIIVNFQGRRRFAH